MLNLEQLLEIQIVVLMMVVIVEAWLAFCIFTLTKYVKPVSDQILKYVQHLAKLTEQIDKKTEKKPMFSFFKKNA